MSLLFVIPISPKSLKGWKEFKDRLCALYLLREDGSITKLKWKNLKTSLSVKVVERLVPAINPDEFLKSQNQKLKHKTKQNKTKYILDTKLLT